ncbi:MAG: type II toxin-antitoxin system RelE/ParE family toxin [Dehalococcoidia bacterium]
MYTVDYYTRPNGQTPALEWIDSLNIHEQARILAKVDKLREEGLKLLQTNMMKPVVGRPNLYELRGGQCRMILYHEATSDKFVLLHGFLKKRQRETREILTACNLLDEYVSNLN